MRRIVGDGMHFDLRTAIGSLLVVYGALLVLYGTLGDQAQYARSLGINVNVDWGLVLLAAGLGLLLLRKKRG
jgi:hypothetical protein